MRRHVGAGCKRIFGLRGRKRSRPPVGDDFMLVVSSTLGVGRLGVPPFAL
jgi:hypothetical protein